MHLNEDEKEFSNYVLRVGDGNPLPTEVNEFDEAEEDQLISIDRMLVEGAYSCPSSSQAPFVPPDPMIIQQLQNKDDRIVALET
ncbi:hypothetical protein F2Q68_00025861 [Brassica cretica]|uniref:Uncharacterized protein n=1 Tax=Brassica cretica TaxID=69181 RepID=A0A8S9IA04_BRACR|nr:hypothetical protein F2Q68_00025861 [Brassica cretica]